MDKKEKQSMVAREKQEVTGAETTRPGRTFTPEVDILEKENEIVILADMPGVAAKDLNIGLADNILTLEGLTGDAEADNEMAVVSEFETGKYFRQFTLADSIDQAKIEASMSNGVMRLVLPKVAKAQPRKISVTAA
ncbi:MAG: Hsp20/alpha crystallin family protein [Desulfatibacillaceae bacterium]|nr:Hsp20/alpha crystallin family protein [Desulfatibacillaceae bacterium]